MRRHSPSASPEDFPPPRECKSSEILLGHGYTPRGTLGTLKPSLFSLSETGSNLCSREQDHYNQVRPPRLPIASILPVPFPSSRGIGRFRRRWRSPTCHHEASSALPSTFTPIGRVSSGARLTKGSRPLLQSSPICDPPLECEAETFRCSELKVVPPPTRQSITNSFVE
jgi:hypothetical protein